MTRRLDRTLLVGAASVVLLAAGSTLAMAAVGGAFDRSSAACTVPDLPGQIVDVSLIDMGNRMGDGMMSGGAGSGRAMAHMRLVATPAYISAGTVSFRVHNIGTRTYELVVLPLGAREKPGKRTVGPDDRIAEDGSLGEASRTCGPAGGEGIEPGSSGWVTMTLPGGRYELVCNLKHHYRLGMFNALSVR